MKKSAEPSVYAGTVSISLLGGFSLEMNGATLTDDINRSLKLWSVLAYLVLHRNRPVPQSEFIELFWPRRTTAPIRSMRSRPFCTGFAPCWSPLWPRGPTHPGPAGALLEPCGDLRGWTPTGSRPSASGLQRRSARRRTHRTLPAGGGPLSGRSAAQAKPSDVADPSLGPLSYAVPRGREGPGRPYWTAPSSSTRCSSSASGPAVWTIWTRAFTP